MTWGEGYALAEATYVGCAKYAPIIEPADMRYNNLQGQLNVIVAHAVAQPIRARKQRTLARDKGGSCVCVCA